MSSESTSYTKNRHESDRSQRSRLNFGATKVIILPPSEPTGKTIQNGTPSPLEAAMVLKSKYIATLHKGLTSFLDDLTNDTLRLYSIYFERDMKYQENSNDVNYVPTAVKTIGLTLQSLEEVKDGKDFKAIRDRYIVDEEATKNRWKEYVRQIDNLTRLGLKKRFHTSFCKLLTSAARGFTAEIGTQPSYTEHEAVMDLLVTSPSLLLGEPLFSNAIDFMNLYKTTNNLAYLPPPTIDHSLEDALTSVNGVCRDWTYNEKYTTKLNSTATTTSISTFGEIMAHGDTSISTSITSTSLIAKQPVPERNQPTVSDTNHIEDAIPIPSDASNQVRDQQENQMGYVAMIPLPPEQEVFQPIPAGDPPLFPEESTGDATEPPPPPPPGLERASKSLPSVTTVKNPYKTVQPDQEVIQPVPDDPPLLPEEVVGDAAEPPPPPLRPEGTSKSLPSVTTVRNPYKTWKDASSNIRVTEFVSARSLLPIDINPPQVQGDTTPTSVTTTQHPDTVTDVLANNIQIQQPQQIYIPTVQGIYTPVPTLDLLCDDILDISSIHTGTPTPFDPASTQRYTMPPKHGEVLLMLRKFAEQAIHLPLTEFRNVTCEKEVFKRIKQATEPIIFTSAADRIAAVVNKESKIQRPVIDGIIRNSTKKANKELNRRIQSLKSTHTTMLEKQKQLELSMRNNYNQNNKSKKGQGSNLRWSRNGTSPTPQAAATVQQPPATIQKPPNNPTPLTPNPNAIEVPPNDLAQNKGKHGMKRSRSKSRQRSNGTKPNSSISAPL